MIDTAKHFAEALDFLEENRALIDCHLVDFITGNLWDTCVPLDIRNELENVTFTDAPRSNNYDFKKFTNASGGLIALLKRADQLSLKNNRSVTLLDDFLTLFLESSPATKNFHRQKSMICMSDKKQHETTVLAGLVALLAGGKTANSLVVDAGAGKGYLSTCISENYAIPVLAIESSANNVEGALRRREMLKKKRYDSSNDLVRYCVHHIDDDTNYKKIIEAHFPERRVDNCVLTGLHTCGELGHSTIKHFLKSDCLTGLCVVPCCYHLTEESLTGRCVFFKNARMIAQQSVERTESNEKYSFPPSLFYRALLQIILQSLDIPDTRVGRGAPTSDFPTYAQWALTKIRVNPEKIPSRESLAELRAAYADSEWKFNVFQTMRIHLGSVVEAAIILDRVVYTMGSGLCSKVALIKLFDPLISPRCYAIVALK